MLSKTKQVQNKLNKKYHAKIADEYDSKRLEDFREADLLQKEFKILDRLLNYPFNSMNPLGDLMNFEDQNILDVACGTGVDFKVYKKRKIYGIDISKDMLAFAKRKYPKANLSVQDATKAFNFPDNKFDNVISSRFICHTPEYKKVIKEMARVTKPGGNVIIDFPNRKSLSSVTTKWRLKTARLAHYNMFTLKEIKELGLNNSLIFQDVWGKIVIPPRMFPKFLYKPIIKPLNNVLSYLFPKISTPLYIKFRKVDRWYSLE